MRRSLVPGAVLAASLFLTTIAATVVAGAGAAGRQARFENAVQAAEDRIQGRLETYTALLRGGTGLFSASGEVTLAEFRSYVAQIEVRQRYPGIQGVGFSKRIAAGAVDSLSAAMRSQGHADFQVHPDTPRAEYHVIVYLEPLDRRNRVAIGYDMFTEPTRREAMERARDHASAALSGSVTLVQEIEERKQAGFLMYLPLYRGGSVPASVAERRERLEGFIYAPFRADDLFEGIFGTEREPRVLFQVYDGHGADPERLLHDSRRPADHPGRRPELFDTATVEIAGRPWTIVYSSAPALERSATRVLVPAVVVVGLLLSLILFAVTQAQARARSEAEDAAAKAAEMAVRLQEQAAELERRVAEAEEARAEAEEANQAKGEFLATMSHELRTPLNAIGGYTDLMELGIHGPVTEAQLQALGRIKSAQQHLLGLINDVLNYARLEAGRVHFSIQDVPVARVVDEVEALVELQLAAGGLSYSSDRCDRALIARGDPERMQQVLLNLLTNAIKFTEPGGWVRVHCDADEERVYLRVSDSGRGIPADRLEQIFDPFVQVDRAGTRTSQQGVGLGLAISRDLARGMNGDLTVESRLGKGTTFTFTLPRVGDAPARPSSPRYRLRGLPWTRWGRGGA